MTHAIALSPRWALACLAALALAVAVPHRALDDPAPEAPGCVGCHHADPEPAPGVPFSRLLIAPRR